MALFMALFLSRTRATPRCPPTLPTTVGNYQPPSGTLQSQYSITQSGPWRTEVPSSSFL